MPITLRDIADRRRIEDEEKDVRDIKLPNAAHQQSCSCGNTLRGHPFRVHERRRVAGNEDENVGSVAEAVIPRRQPSDRIVRDVINKDRPVREAAEKIEMKISSLGWNDRKS